MRFNNRIIVAVFIGNSILSQSFFFIFLAASIYEKESKEK